METAKEIIQESLPIKCLEAVVLSLYLTSPLLNIQRLAVGFKSKFDGMYFRHVVLTVQHGGCYGALGMSRRKDLMFKPLVFKVSIVNLWLKAAFFLVHIYSVLMG